MVRRTYSITVEEDDIAFVQKHKIVGSLIFDTGLDVIKKQMLEKERADKFKLLWMGNKPLIGKIINEQDFKEEIASNKDYKKYVAGYLYDRLCSTYTRMGRFFCDSLLDEVQNEIRIFSRKFKVIELK